MRTSLSSYQIFLTAARTGNFSRAANALYITQPAVSKAVTRLEEELHTTLFVRSSRGVALTEEGRLLYDYIQKGFDTMEQGESVLLRMAELGMGHLRIGVSATLCRYLLLPYLKDFIEKFPHIKITISCQSSYQTVSLLEQDKIDIGLIGKPDSLKDLAFYPVAVMEDTFVAAGAYLENLRLRAGRSETGIFREATLMLLDEENMTRLYIERYFKEYHIETNQILEVTSMDLLIEFAKIGLGAACVIKEFVTEELSGGILRELPLPAPIPRREAGFVYAKNRFQSDAMKKFISVCLPDWSL